jgi:hypothetical protein
MEVQARYFDYSKNLKTSMVAINIFDEICLLFNMYLCVIIIMMSKEHFLKTSYVINYILIL